MGGTMMVVCQQCRQPLEEWEAGFCEGCGAMASCETCGREIKNYGNDAGGVRCANYCKSGQVKPKRGRPAPLGRKVVCSVRLTPDVAEFCREHPDGFPVLEATLRASREFKAWLKARGNQ